MSQVSILTRAAMVTVLALIGLFGVGTSQAAAQRGTATEDSYVSELSDLEVTVAGDFGIDEIEHQQYEHGDGEIVYINLPTAFLQIAFFDDDDEPEETVELFNESFASEMNSFDVLDEGIDRGRVWSFAVTTLEDDEFLYYVDVTPDVVGNVDVMTRIAGPTVTFFDDLEAAQQDVALDGEGIFQEVDVTELEETFGAGGASEQDEETSGKRDKTNSTSTRQTEDDDNTAQADSGERPRSGARLPRNVDVDDVDEENAEADRESPERGGIGFEDAGLVSDNEYTSPQFDIDVEWGDRWLIDHEDEGSVTTDPAGGSDSLFLLWSGEDFAMLFIDFAAAEDLTPDDFVEYWVSEEYLAENADPNAEILLDDSGRSGGAVLWRDYLDEGGELIIFKEAMLLGDGETLAIVTLIAPPDLYSEIYADAESDVEIDGEPAVSVFSQREVQRTLDQ